MINFEITGAPSIRVILFSAIKIQTYFLQLQIKKKKSQCFSKWDFCAGFPLGLSWKVFFSVREN